MKYALPPTPEIKYLSLLPYIIGYVATDLLQALPHSISRI
jgi:hypothetical protein